MLSPINDILVVPNYGLQDELIWKSLGELLELDDDFNFMDIFKFANATRVAAKEMKERPGESPEEA